MSPPSAENTAENTTERGPSLEFDWEAGVFRALVKLARMVKGGRDGERPPHAASLEPLERRLSVLASVVAGEAVRIREAKAEGGIVGSTVFLPRSIAVADDLASNVFLYVVRTAVAATIMQMGVDPKQGEVVPVERAVCVLSIQYPSFRSAWQRACWIALSKRPDPERLARSERALEWARRELLVRGAEVDLPYWNGVPPGKRSLPVVLWGSFRSDDRLPEGDLLPDMRPPERGAGEVRIKPVESIDLVRIEEKDIEEQVVHHSFEKVDTADDYNGGARELDGSNELEDHGEALEELDFGKVIRTNDAVHAVLRADVGGLTEIPDVSNVQPEERGIPYDEWDARKGAYLPKWCTVYPTSVSPEDTHWHVEPLARHRRLVRELERAITLRRTRLATLSQQRDGEHIDIDAVVRHVAAGRAHHDSAPKIYRRRVRREREVAFLLLMDISLSSDSWIDDRRVLDVARESVLVLGEVASAIGDSLSVMAFASRTRTVCRVFDIMGSKTSWPIGRARMGALTPQGYTRIGPALRHATARLAEEEARHKVLLLVSDGKPTDYDRYEGRHGIADVRQAVREADRSGVTVHGLTLDPRAAETMPAMLGPGRFHPLNRVEELPRALTTLFEVLSTPP